MKLKNPGLGFLLVMGSTGIGLKSLMGTFVSWAAEWHQSGVGRGSTKPQVPKMCPGAIPTAPALPGSLSHGGNCSRGFNHRIRHCSQAEIAPKPVPAHKLSSQLCWEPRVDQT